MKKAFFYSLLLLVVACTTDKLDTAKAQKIGEELISKIDKENYDEAFKLYTKDFNATVPVADRITQFKKMKSALGEVQSIKLVDAKNQAEASDEPNVILTFEVKHSRINSREVVVVVYDEGAYRVANHSIVGE